VCVVALGLQPGLANLDAALLRDDRRIDHVDGIERGRSSPISIRFDSGRVLTAPAGPS